MRTKLQLLISLCFYGTLLICQPTELSYTGSVPTLYTGHSPDASTLQSGITNNEDLYSGSSNVSIPLHTVQDLRFEIPININFNTQGIRVNEHPGWLGCNASTSANASISRIVKGEPDELVISWTHSAWENPINTTGFVINYVGLFYAFNDLAGPNWASMATIVNASLGFINEVFGTVPKHTYYKTFYKDLEPDRFVYNIFGNSGEFYLAPDGKFYDLNGQYEIEPISSFFDVSKYPDLSVDGWDVTNLSEWQALIGFRLMATNGMEYSFLLPEYSHDFFEFSYERRIISTWHLTDIIDNTNQHCVSFNYEQQDYVANFNGYRFYRDSPTTNGAYTTRPEHRLAGRLFQPHYLTSIETPNYLVTFENSNSEQLEYEYSLISNRYNQQLQNYYDFIAPAGHKELTSVLTHFWGPSPSTTQMLDSLNWYKLDKIEIAHKHNNAQSTLHEYEFNYNNDPGERLILESFGETGLPLYELTYDNFEGLINSYPLGLGYEDHQGYYNNNLFPSYTTTSTNAEFSAFKALRDPNFNYAKRGSLKSIKLPSGARYEYTYEPLTYGKKYTFDFTVKNFAVSNQSGTGCGLRLKNKSLVLPDGKIETISYEYEDGVLYNDPKYFRPNMQFEGINNQTYSISEFSTASVFSIPINKERNVSYGKVSVIYPNNGKEEYNFSTYLEEPNQLFDFSEQSTVVSNQFAFHDNANQRGLLLSKNTLSEDNTLLQKSQYEYVDNNDSIPEIRGIRINFTFDPPIMDAYAYTIPAPRKRIGVNVEQMYLQNATTPLTKIDSSEFKQWNNYVLPSRTASKNSDGTIYSSEYQYSDTYPDTAIRASLLYQHIFQPWNVTHYAEQGGTNTLIGGYQNEIASYNSFDGTLLSSPSSFPFLPVLLHQQYQYEVTWDEAGIYSLDTALQYTIKEYDIDIYSPSSSTVLPRIVNINGWLDDHYYSWSPSGNIAVDSFRNYVSRWDYYDENNMLRKKTGIDGLSHTLTYDSFQRLASLTHDQCQWSTYYDYHYPDGAGDKGFIKDSTYYALLGNEPGSIVNKAFVDGASRPIQTLRVRQDPDNSNHHIASQSIEYDEIGRPHLSYEPWTVTTTNPEYAQPDPQSDRTQTYYEASPLYRTDSILAPQWYATSYEREINDANDIYDYNHSQYYPEGSLYKSSVLDPNGNKTVSYVDLRGKEVVMRKESEDGALKDDTYTIRDLKLRTSYILPPSVMSGDLNLQYRYLYYGNNQIAMRDLPDADPITYVYNDRDLLSYVQDGNMAVENKYWVSYHDPFGNTTLEGFGSVAPPVNGSFYQAVPEEFLLQRTYGSTGVNTGKLSSTRSKFLMTNEYYDTDYYYDNCGRPREFSNTIFNPSNAILRNTYLPVYDSRGEIIRAQHWVEDGNEERHILRKHFDFDHVGRLTGASIQKGGSGQKLPLSNIRYTPKEQIASKALAPNSDLLNLEYDYLPNGFLKSISDPLFTQELYYDSPHNGQASARYNGDISTQVWKVKGQEDAYYNYEYDFKDQIKEAKYHVPSQASLNGAFDADFSYDNRGNILTINRSGAISNKSVQKGMDELTFHLKHNSNQIQDVVEKGDAKRGYKSSQQKNNTTYTYDANGNMTCDPSRGITMTMNHFNKANRIEKDANNYIDYYYDANGQLHRKKVVEGGQTTEVRDYIREVELVDGELDLIHFSDGYLQYRDGGTYLEDLMLTGQEHNDSLHMASRIHSSEDIHTGSTVTYLADSCITMSPTFIVDQGVDFTAVIDTLSDAQSDWIVNYTIKDHLGNTRMVVTDDNLDGTIDTSEIKQVAHFYPFGAKHSVSKTGPYHYDRAGAEREKAFDLGLDLHPYRDFDPLTGRFRQVDPAAEFYSSLSPLHYSFNNPINFIDPTGAFIDYLDQKGNLIGSDGVDDGRIVIITDKKEVKNIKKTHKTGGVTDLTQVKSGVEIPSEYVRGEMFKAVLRAGSPSFHEEGGQIGVLGNGDDFVIHAKPGEKADPIEDGFASIDVFQVNNVADIPNDPDAKVIGTFHTHPDGEKSDGENFGFFENEPSDLKLIDGERYGDIPNAATATRATGNRFVLAQGNKTVYIYNGSGTIAKLPFSSFFPN